MSNSTSNSRDVETGTTQAKQPELGKSYECNTPCGHHNQAGHLDLEKVDNNDKRVFILLTQAIRYIGNLTGIVVFIYELITNYLY